ncbi:hypothetical protein ACIO3O_32720 [Streptomyces sp. NPDC087440]|uniref:hypothetical protein n=1 Tax=Streptomyces sp. NPDC087440 TaxID=3365790 RepID=UPI00382DF9C8
MHVRTMSAAAVLAVSVLGALGGGALAQADEPVATKTVLNDWDAAWDGTGFRADGNVSSEEGVPTGPFTATVYTTDGKVFDSCSGTVEANGDMFCNNQLPFYKAQERGTPAKVTLEYKGDGKFQPSSASGDVKTDGGIVSAVNDGGGLPAGFELPSLPGAAG